MPLVLEIAEESARRGAPGSWILDFTNPVGIVTQALLDAGHHAIGLCNVAIGFQRGLARHFERDARAGLRSTTSASTTCRGSGRSGSTASTACRSCSRPATRTVTLGGDFPLVGRPGAGRDPVLLPALLLRDRRHPARAARGRQPGDRRHPHRARAARPLPRPDAGPQARAAGAARRRVLQRGGRGAHRVALHGRRRDPRRRHVQPRRDPEPARRCGGRGPGAHRPLRRDADPDRAAGRPRCSAWSSTSRRTSCWRSRRRSAGEDPIALRALVANPLVKGDAGALLDAIIEANLRYLPRFVASAASSG